ncbi:GDSL-type esterase/lipase family protein [Marivita sp. XM-24bin2]|jgi:lysophospholipase L1-like esterase|uniref:GDSL-type esterase/lipase family protein n=1 Tax=unclassified Marivita TaxID=2632480 RepID=UPI000D7B5934|nr:GDSL-type esterase/lipase family protein [Marivita sp. XM-24bin2]MCR9109237.1 GDSL-type esterase/lipase family protein [Paracoccaceae bacterium]PWL33978.1 MAG: GDSL family lipase [Marivita sp. XM-24bin2]
MAVILCYGDSNTHGTIPLEKLGAFARHAPGNRWPDVLGQALGSEHQVISEGLPGRTTVHDDTVEGGMRNGLTVLPAILQSHAPIDLMVLMLGTNDLKNRFSVTAFEISRSLERLILATRAEGVVKDILLVSPVPVREAGVLKDVFAGAETRQQGLTSFIEAAADRQGVGFFDAGSAVSVSPVDGVHWDAAGHHAMGAAMVQAVASRL